MSLTIREITTITVAELRTKLHALQLPISGTKAELIARLNEFDPSEEWRRNGDEQPMILPNERNAEELHREVDLPNREHEVLRRELEITRRELAMARARNNDEHPPNGHSRTNIRMLSELLKEFSGAHDGYWQWEQQARFFKDTYQLDDDSARILLGLKLRGSASEWFHSSPEHLEMTFGELLSKMKDMYDHRPTMRTLRRQFENQRAHKVVTMPNEANQQIAAASSSYNIAAPETFDFNSPSDWPRWRRRFERFRLASKLNTLTEEEQVNTLIYLMGEKADEIMITFALTAAEEKNYNTIMQRFEGHFSPKTNVIYERARFHTRIQNPGESACDFVTALHNLASKCNYGNLKDEFIRDRIVVGIADKKLSEKMQLDDTLTLDKAVKTITQSEEIKKQTEQLNQSSINQVSSQPKYQKKKNAGSKQYKNRIRNLRRIWTNQTHANGAGGKNTIGKNAPPKTQTATTATTKAISLTPANSRKSSIDAENTVGSIDWTAVVRINGKNIRCKIDTGSDVTALPPEYAEGRGLTNSTKKLTGPDTTTLKIHGTERATLTYKNQTTQQTIYYIHNLLQPILGRTDAVKLGLVKKIDAISSPPGLSLEDVKRKFPKLFNGIGKIPGKCKLTVKPNVEPVAVTSPRCIAIPLIEKVKTILEKMVEEGIISAVNEPTDWCSPMVVTFKKDSNPRICVDMRELNRAVKRERSIRVLPNSPGRGVAVVHHVHHTIRKVLLQPPTIRDHMRFHKKMQEVLKGCDGIVCLMDDILVYGDTQEEHDRRLIQALTKLQQAKMTLNEKKLVINSRSVEFLGHLIEEKGTRIHPDKIRAVTEMEPPKDRKGVKRLIGMINFLAKAIPDKATILEPLQAHLKEDIAFIWGKNQESAFTKIKEVLTTAPTLARFDPAKKTIVTADASSFGIGGALLQVQRDGSIKPIAYSSRLLSETEKRYSQIEKEALAVTYVCEKFSDYLTGIEVLLETDHKPLIPILTTKSLNDLSPRLQRYRIRLMRFDYTINHVPGKDLVTADALSRQPVVQKDPDELFDEVENHVIGAITHLPVSPDKLAEIIEKQKADPELAAVRVYIRNGWPDKETLNANLKPFYEKRSDISCQNDLLFYESRIVIPRAMHSETLSRIHEGHLGITKCRARANQVIWWPGMSKQIAETVMRCEICAQYRDNRHEPLIQIEEAHRPWQKVGMDLFKLRSDWYLIIIDRYSRYPEVEKVPNMRMETVILKMSEIFARQGVPEEILTDNGTQFNPFHGSSLFKNFQDAYGFRLITRSPGYPQSNGLAEAGVQLVKKIFLKEGDPYKGLLIYRNTPLKNGYSPAELSMSRRLRDTLPTTASNLEPRVVCKEAVGEKEDRRRKRIEDNYNKSKGTRQLPELTPGTRVFIKDAKKFGTVIQKAEQPRSYIIQTDTNKLRRNRYTVVPTQPAREATAVPHSQPEDPLPQGSNTIRSPPREPTTPDHKPGDSQDVPEDYRTLDQDFALAELDGGLEQIHQLAQQLIFELEADIRVPWILDFSPPAYDHLPPSPPTTTYSSSPSYSPVLSPIDFIPHSPSNSDSSVEFLGEIPDVEFLEEILFVPSPGNSTSDVEFLPPPSPTNSTSSVEFLLEDIPSRSPSAYTSPVEFLGELLPLCPINNPFPDISPPSPTSSTSSVEFIIETITL
ncbi:PREDICTED: uncharacterized protein LOC105557076 [Vollenhovia emeryi]|uniref:uncharacterized protein LOC105557076 n=1 Tax=Vollenhovia emeryi TaxID=411798 RepID=UPI0005F4CBBC|nr:PREDICTED: uncharacterized protein LOC105557076 [Vollenhovia emeryi]